MGIVGTIKVPMNIIELLAQLAIALLANLLSNKKNDCGNPQSARDYFNISVKLHFSIKLSVKIVLWIRSLLCAILGLMPLLSGSL